MQIQVFCCLTAVEGHIVKRGMDRILKTKLTKLSNQVVTFIWAYKWAFMGFSALVVQFQYWKKY